MLGLLGRKLGMTQVFGKNGDQFPVTILKVGPCTVVQKKTKKTDGYDALQIGFEEAKPSKLTKARRMHCEKKGVSPFINLKEFRTENVEKFNVGAELIVSGFQTGDIVDIIGVTKGRGFQGVIKRHGKHGGPASHGSDFHRRPGSTGMNTWPGRVFKNMRMPGHMGNDNVTIKNISVVDVQLDKNLIFIRGGIPGPVNGLVTIVNRTNGFEQRAELVRQNEKQTKKQDSKASEKTDESVNEAVPNTENTMESETKENKD